MNRHFLISLLVILVVAEQSAAQVQNVHFDEPRKILEEKRDTMYYTISFTIDTLLGTGQDTLRLFNLGRGDASLNDFTLPQDTLYFFCSPRSSRKHSFVIVVLADSADESRHLETIILGLRFRSRNYNNTADSLKTETDTLLIKDVSINPVSNNTGVS